MNAPAPSAAPNSLAETARAPDVRERRRAPCAVWLLAVAIGGCATGPAVAPNAMVTREGTVESVEQLSPRCVSALTGMLMGSVIGSSGSGAENRRVGLALGALGGAWAVNPSGLDSHSQGYRVTVRLDDGTVEHIQNSDPVGVPVGQRVAIAGHRLVHPAVTTLAGSPVSASSL